MNNALTTNEKTKKDLIEKLSVLRSKRQLQWHERQTRDRLQRELNAINRKEEAKPYELAKEAVKGVIREFEIPRAKRTATRIRGFHYVSKGYEFSHPNTLTLFGYSVQDFNLYVNELSRHIEVYNVSEPSKAPGCGMVGRFQFK